MNTTNASITCRHLTGLFLIGSLTACGTIQTRNTVVIEQAKPIEVNVNLHADINVVITDARKDMEQITGQKPIRMVSPADIGLPPDSPAAGTSASPGAALPAADSIWLADNLNSPVLLLADLGTVAPRTAQTVDRQNVDRSDDLKAAMAARNKEVRALLDTHLAGEAHTGLLSARGELSADQQKLTNTENADRSELYKLEAAKKNISVEKVALSYYLARLDYAQKGDWYERYNKDTKAWEWAQWAN